MPISRFSLSLCLMLIIALSPAVMAQPSCVNSEATSAATTVDDDADGLIEICTIAGLHAIRHQLDGTGYTATAEGTKVTSGCPDGGCKGYELINNLDFDGYSYPDGNARWLPIGTNFSPFTSIFEGNGHTIDKLRINRGASVAAGLFNTISSSARIANIGLLNVNSRGGLAGGLVGINLGTITNSYATGRVEGFFNIASGVGTGGLAGQNDGTITNSYAMATAIGNHSLGGLVGENTGTITNSYATGTATGSGSDVGGLVGRNDGSGTITNSYATGAVTGTSNIQGGLVGNNQGTITNSYATGAVTGSGNNLGGLVGSNSGTITSSYWDKETSEQNTSAGSSTSAGLTTAQLQSPTAPSATNPDRYTNWNTNDWDFGTAIQYPLLKYARGSDTNNPACYQSGDSGPKQPACGTLLSGPNYFSATPNTCINSKAATAATDVDDDGNGLIEICTIDALDAIRHQLDGTGYKKTAGGRKFTGGCPESGCKGYELINNLDFAGYSYPDGAAAWLPIGTNTNPFTSTFEGSEHTIDNLMINRATAAYVGLFGSISSSARIANIGLLNVNVTGNNNAGSLVGENAGGTIINSYATGTVTGSGNNLGGLVGSNNGGTITNSYATGAVTGSGNMRGGLVGGNTGTITNSYATGAVTGSGNMRGGLVGGNTGTITNSYATGAVTGSGNNLGGLVGSNSGTITSSYWDKETSGQTSSAGSLSSAGLTTAQLQSPTAPSATNPNRYTNWNTNDWDFGTARQYPLLKYARGSDNNNPACYQSGDSGSTQPACGILLSGPNYFSAIPNTCINSKTATAATDVDDDGNGLIEICTIDALDAIRHQLDGTAYKKTAGGRKFTGGCPESGCKGYELINNLDFDGYSYPDSVARWLPIGTNTSPFTSTFEGNGHTIDNLMINRATAAYVGLFGAISSSARIANIGLLNVNVIGSVAGGLVGINNNGTITNSYATGRVEGRSNVIGAGTGGLVGVNQGAISNSYATVATTGNNSAGGLVGVNQGGTISNSYATGTVTGSGSDVGGLVGRNDGTSTIINSYATGTVTGTSNTRGGLVGRNEGTITNSYATGAVTGSGNTLGGLVGANTGTITSSYWNKETSGQTSSAGSPNSAGLTTAQLQSPTAPNATNPARYTNWNTNNWYFGTASQYPLPRAFTTNTCINSEAATAVTDVDDDGNGLIEICTIDDLHAIRHQLDGTGYTAAAGGPKVTSGCPESGCKGYELINNLDFHGYSYLGGATSWLPIGDFRVSFTSTFEGNGHTIDNLPINRPRTTSVGLFGVISSSARIANIGLLNVNMIGSITGGLVGINNNGTITNSYATGRVEGVLKIFGAGTGGLVGVNQGAIINSHATVAATANNSAGGLVGVNQGGSITNSYATGTVTGSGSEAGGLVGRNDGTSTIINSYATVVATGTNNTRGGLVGNNQGTITNSYAIGTVTGSGNNLGGLVGANSGTITSSYWNKEISEQNTSAGSPNSAGLTTAQLQSPTAPSATNPARYTNWNTNDWDFGTARQYPLLKYARGSDTENPACYQSGDSGPKQPTCGTILPRQDFLSTNTTATVVVGSDKTAVEFDDIAEGDTVELDLQVMERDSLTFRWTEEDSDITSELDKTKATLQFTVPTTYTGTMTSRTLIFRVSITDGLHVTQGRIELNVKQKDNGSIMNLTAPTFDSNTRQLNAPTFSANDDPDGVDDGAPITYQWQRCAASCRTNASWTNIAGATQASYTIPQGTSGQTQFRVRITYQDNQEYQKTISTIPIQTGGIRMRLKLFLEGALP